MNKLKMSLLTVFIFGCVSVNAQMPHFSREKPHKSKTLIVHSGTVFQRVANPIKWERLDTIYTTKNILPDSTIEELRTLRMLNDSLQKKLEKLVTFHSYACSIISTLNLTPENKFQFKRVELARSYRLYLEYYEPEYIANARKRQRK